MTSITFVFPDYSYSFSSTCRFRKTGTTPGCGLAGACGTASADLGFMGFHSIAGAAYRALTAVKDGPSLYDVCDPLLLNHRGGDPHLGKFYKTALGNPALRHFSQNSTTFGSLSKVG